jgi:hypothetical protein
MEGLRAIVADVHHAVLLGIEEGEPLLVRGGLSYTTRDQPVPIEAFESVSHAQPSRNLLIRVLW